MADRIIEVCLKLVTREFIEMPEFIKKWDSFGLSEIEKNELENRIMADPMVGDVIQGTGGLRKMRFALPGKGRSGGIRVCYIDYPETGKTILITAFRKKEKENLSRQELNTLSEIIRLLDRYYGGRNG